MKTPFKSSLQDFTEAYIQALFFTDAGPDNEIPSDAELAAETRDKINADCAAFMEKAGELITECSRGTGEYNVYQQAGHDFWFTRNGHGVGFWDGDWPESEGEALTTLSKSFREVSPYLGDDGLIYLA